MVHIEYSVLFSITITIYGIKFSWTLDVTTYSQYYIPNNLLQVNLIFLLKSINVIRKWNIFNHLLLIKAAINLIGSLERGWLGIKHLICSFTIWFRVSKFWQHNMKRIKHKPNISMDDGGFAHAFLVELCKSMRSLSYNERKDRNQSYWKAVFSLKLKVYIRNSYLTTKRQYTSRRQKVQPYLPCFIISSKAQFLITAKIGGIYTVSG